MAEPTSTAASVAALAAATGVALPMLTMFGVPLGLRLDLLLAGFFGAIAAIALLDSVPSTGDSLAELLKTSFKRVGVATGSAATAGYTSPLVAMVSVIPVPDTLLLALSFVIGAGAQRFLRWLIGKFVKDNVRGKK